MLFLSYERNRIHLYKEHTMEDNVKSANQKKKLGRPKSTPEPIANGLPDEETLQRNTEILRSMPDNIAAALAKARHKPNWCSDVRWRMELRRRAYRY